VCSGQRERNTTLPGFPPIFFNVLFISEASVALYKNSFGIAQHKKGFACIPQAGKIYLN